jgi:hypothetical protein
MNLCGFTFESEILRIGQGRGVGSEIQRTLHNVACTYERKRNAQTRPCECDTGMKSPVGVFSVISLRDTGEHRSSTVVD